jgi:hypothetical protein
MPKNFSKKLFTLILAFQAASFLFFIPAPTQAADIPDLKNPLTNLQVKIPGLEKLAAEHPATCDEVNGETKCQIPWIGVYISSLYKYGIGIVGILAAVILMVGGIIWLTAGGNQTRVGEAKAWIGASLTGLIIALTSYMILYQVNPSLTQFRPVEMKIVTGTPETKTLPISMLKCAWTSIPLIFTNATDKCVSVIGSGWKESPGKCKEADKSTTSLLEQVCCCPVLGGDWTFDAGIQNQIIDASPELNNLLNCMRSNLPINTGRISSISDNNNRAAQNFNECDSCPTGTTKSGCAHTCQSCHYGGGASNLSQAVDFGDEENKNIITATAIGCNAGYIIDENNHIHVSTNSCQKN